MSQKSKGNVRSSFQAMGWFQKRLENEMREEPTKK
jgi:hypothetical protein